MSCYSKESLNRNDYNNVCKSHSARSDREIYRICPSKLSKRELEDLYFSLLENNLELKRTVNGQHDKIKGLSTKVQRMTTAQRLLQGKEYKDCCVGSKVVINEQRESITELRRANQKLSEKLQQLNMRLCSAKQFHRKPPSQPSTSRCVRCATVTTGAPMMRRNNDRSSEVKLTTSMQCEDSPMSPNSAQTEDDPNNKGCSQVTCDENRCKTAMQELQMKIVNLQDELNMVHEDYSARLTRLETEVLDVRKENVRVTGERTASLHQLETSLQKNGEVMAEYRTAEARCAELEAQLVIERRKVAELETQLKAANMSDKVNRTIEDRLSSINETNGTTKSAINGTAKSTINGITNIPQRTSNVTSKTRGITRATSGALSRTMASSTFKSTTNGTAKSVTNGTTKSTSNGIAKPTTKSTTNGTTKSSPKGTPVAAIANVPQATATTDTTSKATSENTDTNTTTNETTTTDANITSNVVTDDNMTTDVTKTTTTDDNIPTQATETATTNDSIPTSATTATTATTDDNIPTGATTDDNIPIIATKTATTDGTGSPTRDTQGTADGSKPVCQCIEITDDKPTTAPRESEEAKFHDCDCTSHQMLETDLAGASSTSATKGDANGTKYAICACHPPQDSSTPEKKTKNIECRCKAWQKAMELLEEDSRCRKCCYKELDVRVMESIAKNVVLTTATINTTTTTTTATAATTATTATPATTATTNATRTTTTTTTAAGDTVVSPSRVNEATSKASDDSGYVESNRSQDTDELGIHKLNKQLLAKVLELQSEVASLRRAQESNMLETKKKPGEKVPAPKTSNNMPASTRTERPARVENVDYDRQVPLQTITQTSVKVDEGSIRSTKKKQYQDNVEMSETNKHNRQYTAAVTQLPEDNKFKTLADNISVVTQYRPDTEPTSAATDSTHTQTDAKLKTLKAMPLTLDSSNLNLRAEPNKTEMVEDKLRGTQATDTTDPRKMQPVQGGFKFTDTAQQSEQSRATEHRQADKLVADNQYLHASVSAAGSLASNPDLGVIMHSKLARNNVRERGNAVKLYDGSETEYSNRLKLPMAEALVANRPATNEATEVSTAELCEQCAACTFDRECATRCRNTNDSGNTNIGKETKKEQVTKTDDHNNLQIPGPLPTDNYKEKKRSIFSRFSIDKKRDKSKRNSKSENVNSAAIAKNTAATTEGPIMLPDVPLIDQPGNDTRRVSYTVNKDSNNIQRKRNSRDRRPSTGLKDQGGNMEVPNFGELTLTDRIMPPMGDGYKNEYETAQMKTETKEQASQATPDLQSMLRERAGSMRWRDVSVYRRTSGTLCYRPLPADYDPDCHCPGQVDGHCLPLPINKEFSPGIQVEDEFSTRRVSIFSEPATNTVANKTKRSASFDNTEYEMSFISDLPLEKDVTGKSPDRGRVLSPGEDKTTTTTTTYTESYNCSPTTNYYSLSEGEVPTSTKRKVSYDNGNKDRTDDTTGAPRSEQSAAKMEAALRAIQEELARCKSLLQAQRPESQCQPHARRVSQTSVSDVSRPISLRPGVAKQSIGDAYAPKCNFTLHIGTVVLSDEAVLSSRDKTMVLTWKFYDQNVAMTRMRPGRVVLFDFSTEYDLKITEHFLNYMKHEEMKITICELNRENEPFATCSLPLRDALLLTNRRADMSLALLAGPRLMRMHDALDGGDEVGVIDLWCMLRAEGHVLPGINRAIAQQTSSPTLAQSSGPRNSRVMPQILDDDRYNDLDLALENSPPVNTSPISSAPPNHLDKNVARGEDYNQTSYYWNTPRTAPVTVTSDGMSDSRRQELIYDPSNYPPMRQRRFSATSTSTNLTNITTSNVVHENPEHDSGIIINDVRTKIKSPDDMRQVLEKNYDLNRLDKVEDDTTRKVNPSFGSLKSTAKLQRRSSRYPHKRESQRGDLQNISRSSRATEDKVDISDMEIYRKYENIGKLIGPNRNEASKKCVKILPKYTDQGEEEPQREEEYLTDEEAVSGGQRLDITVLWLALNEECEAMIDPHVQRVYVAYTFLGRAGADLETPVSLPKPKHYVDKCYFNFKKTFELEDTDLMKLSHMARCRAASKMSQDERDCIIFTVVSEPAEDPLGLESCEDIGYAYLYLGDLLAYSAGSPGYTEVLPVRGARGPAAVTGVLAVRIDGLHVVRRCLLLPTAHDGHS